MAGKIEVHAFTEPLRPEQGMDHADHFGALVVHGQGVEIIDLDKGIRPDRMGHGPAILTKLERTDHIDVMDTFDRPGGHISGKLLVSENRQPFLETELKPIAAGNAVPGPVMEIFMGNDALYPLVIHISGRFGAGQHILGVKDIESLVLHGAHVEIIHRHNHVPVKIIFPAKFFLVPAHGLFQ